MADRIRAYRAWMWRRLAVLLAGGALALAGALWFALEDPCPPAVRVPCIAIAGLLVLLHGYLALRTRSVVRDGGRLPLQVARTRRREMRPAAVVPVCSALVLAALLTIPAHRHAATDPIDPGPIVLRKSRGRVPVEAPPAAPPPAPIQPVEVVESTPEPRTPTAAAGPARVEPPATATANGIPPAAAQGKPEIRPELVLEPAHLVLEDDEPAAPSPPRTPEAPTAAAPAAGEGSELYESLSAFRVDRDHFGEPLAPGAWWIGLQFRPLPDENDPESKPRPEGRAEGFLLLGGGDRVPGLTLAVDLPFGKYDLVEVSWMAAELPRANDVDHTLSADWHHATLAYVRRLAGYTSHAKTDVAVSLGVSMDHFGDVQGVSDPGGPKFTPYAALDVAFWQQEVVGLLIHLGENFPTTVFGSAMGMTDLSVQIRWDLNERISVHGGYRVVRLRYKSDDASPTVDPLNEGLSGPILGVDIRF